MCSRIKKNAFIFENSISFLQKKLFIFVFYVNIQRSWNIFIPSSKGGFLWTVEVTPDPHITPEQDNAQPPQDLCSKIYDPAGKMIFRG